MPARMTPDEFARLGRPREERPPRRPPRREEALLLKQVLDWLKLKGIFHWRANSGAGLRKGRGGRTYPVRMNPEGTPDVLAVLPLYGWTNRTGAAWFGRLVGIELKAGKGRLRPSQLAWKAAAEAAGVLCLEIRSLDELVEAFRREGVA